MCFSKYSLENLYRGRPERHCKHVSHITLQLFSGFLITNQAYECMSIDLIWAHMTRVHMQPVYTLPSLQHVCVKQTCD